jgi:lysophospholipase L1-like esterase
MPFVASSFLLIPFASIRRMLSLGVALAFCTDCPAQHDLPADALGQHPVRVACVGDSITDGYQMPDKGHNAYPAQLANLLGPGYDVQNFGVSGATLMRRGGYPYDQRPAAAAALALHPDIVVVALGTNDTKTENIAAHPDDFMPSYRALIADFRAANPRAKIFICLPPPAFPEAMGISDDVLRHEILPRIQQIAKEEKLPLIDLHTPLEDAAAFFPDKIHPTAEGAARIAEIVYGELMFATQPRANSLAASINTAVVPVPRLEDDSYNWWRRHAETLAARTKLIDPEIVLIGDSITHFWAGEPRAANHLNGPRAWAETFGTRRVLNLGFGWDRTQNVLWRLDHGEFDALRPKLVIVNIGTNNLSATPNARANQPAEIAEGIAAIVDRIRRKSPTAHILVMGVLPRGHGPGDAWRSPIKSLNVILARQLAGKPDTTFLDISARFLAVDGSLPTELMPDGTHPSEQGYSIWGRAIIETGLLPPVGP